VTNTDIDRFLKIARDIREDVREDNNRIFAKLEHMDKRIDQHAKYWSITFFVGKLIAGVGAMILGVSSIVKGWFT